MTDDEVIAAAQSVGWTFHSDHVHPWARGAQTWCWVWAKGLNPGVPHLGSRTREEAIRDMRETWLPQAGMDTGGRRGQ